MNEMYQIETDFLKSCTDKIVKNYKLRFNLAIVNFVL